MIFFNTDGQTHKLHTKRIAPLPYTCTLGAIQVVSFHQDGSNSNMTHTNLKTHETSEFIFYSFWINNAISQKSHWRSFIKMFEISLKNSCDYISRSFNYWPIQNVFYNGFQGHWPSRFLFELVAGVPQQIRVQVELFGQSMNVKISFTFLSHFW